MRDAIETFAQSRGAVSMRVASANVDETSRDRLDAAFRRGDLATWPYDAAYADAAVDPARLLDGARSVLCFAFAYATPAPRERSGHGRVSNYAWSSDYHGRVRRTLDDIAQFVDERYGARSVVACDTKPIAERAYAARAGLGWVGKHTNLIAPRTGSFVFLGEVVTTLDLESDAPLKTSCGNCTRCVARCPTEALRGDYTIDATRCISDLTQRTDVIPRELRPLMGTWVWGCDICQDVCPPTRNAGYVAQPLEHAPLADNTASPSLIALLQLRSGEFKRIYAKTAMGWRGAAVLRRNAAIALGNTLDRATVPALVGALERDPHELVRGASAWALGRIASPAAIAALRRGGSANTPYVTSEIRAALEPFERTTR